MKPAITGDYKFILNYQDHLTKFVILRALKRKSADEVAAELVDICPPSFAVTYFSAKLVLTKSSPVTQVVSTLLSFQFLQIILTVGIATKKP